MSACMHACVCVHTHMYEAVLLLKIPEEHTSHYYHTEDYVPTSEL